MSLKVSIITVCRNAEQTIESTIQSVLNQTYSNIEHVVIDGLSSDRTVSLVNRYANSISYFVSEKDGGIYQAMEKGIKAAKGDVVYFLNSGDLFYSNDTVERVVSMFNSKKVDIVFGDLYPYLLNENDSYSHSFKPGEVVTQESIRKAFDLLNINIHHQTIFYRKHVLDKASFFSIGYPSGTDWGLHAEAIIGNRSSFFYFSRPIAKFLLGGVSTSNFEKELIEYNKIKALVNKKYGCQSLNHFSYKIIKKIRNILTK